MNIPKIAQSGQHYASLGDAMEALAAIMAQLRHPDTGCPWDQKQTFNTIAPYTIEEAYEVADAIQRHNMPDLCEELGDLLLQVFYHAQMAEELKHFQILDVVRSIIDKMLRRHPHVFGDQPPPRAGENHALWESIKAEERRHKYGSDPQTAESALDGVAVALPALQRAERLQSRAARVGFDWPSAEGAIEKVREEFDEVVAAQNEPAHLAEEMGDLLFAVVNVSRKLGIDSEAALRDANAKFTRRFHAMEGLARSRGLRFEALSLEAQDALWKDVKNSEISK